MARIITNYFQVILLIYSLDLQWPPNVEEFLTQLSFVQSASGSIFQTDCYFQSGKSI